PPPPARPAGAQARGASVRAAREGPAPAARGWARAGSCAGLLVRAHRSRSGLCVFPGVFIAIFLLNHRLGHQLFADLGLQARGHLRVVLQVLPGVLLALADAFLAQAVPGARPLHEPGVHAHVDQLAPAADALAVQDLGDDLLERRRHLVLDHLDPGLVADDLVALLDRADAADIKPDRGVELQRVAAGGGLRALARHHDADLVAKLVDEE